jgi:hypothetical protein
MWIRSSRSATLTQVTRPVNTLIASGRPHVFRGRILAWLQQRLRLAQAMQIVNGATLNVRRARMPAMPWIHQHVLAMPSAASLAHVNLNLRAVLNAHQLPGIAYSIMIVLLLGNASNQRARARLKMVSLVRSSFHRPLQVMQRSLHTSHASFLVIETRPAIRLAVLLNALAQAVRSALPSRSAYQRHQLATIHVTPCV